ncbi:MAG: hypothetical protein FWC39_06780 [Bacteroidetes bacterium]|nr:hypothetical protein [Bacteroidota bacterium]
MSKRILSFIVVLCLVGIIVFIFIRLKQSNQTFENLAFETVPHNAVALIDVKKISSLEQFATNNMWRSFASSPLFTPMHTVATLTQTALKNEVQRKNFANNSLIISFMECKEGTQEYIVSVPLVSSEQINQTHELLQNLFSDCQKVGYSFDYNTQIYSFENAAKKRRCSYAVFKNTLIISPSHILVEAAIKSCKEQHNILGIEDFKKIRKTAGKQTLANIYINLNKVTQLFMPLQTKPYGSWTEFDVSLRSNAISLNGFSLSNITADFLSVFRAQMPVKLQLSSILPANISYFKVWGLSDVKQFRANYENFLTQNKKFEDYTKNLNILNNTYGGSNIVQNMYSFIDSEIAFACGAPYEANENGDNYAIIKTISQSQVEGWIEKLLQEYPTHRNPGSSQTTQFTLDNKAIYTIQGIPVDFVQALWGELFAGVRFRHLTFINNYMVFADSKTALEKLITAYELKKVLANDMEFKKFQNSVLPTFTYYEYAAMGKTGNAHTPLRQIQSEELGIAQRSNAAAFQIMAQDGMFYNNIYINFAEAGSTAKTSTADNIVWESVLDAEIATQPQIFEIQPGEFGILVQDEKNTLYMLNSAGKIQWKKSLQESLISPLFQVDYFKNGKYQYLANSANYVYCIDRLGNFVENYPHKLEDTSSVAMSVFDYEKTKEYRLFVPCGKKLYLYNIKMQKNKEWAWNECESDIVAPVQHFVNAGKDYIVCADQRNVYLLNRKGELRAKANEQFEKSPQTPWYYQRKTQMIVTTDVNASIKAMDFGGKVHTLQKDSLPKNHYFLYSPANDEYALIANKKCTFYTSQMVPISIHELGFAVEITPHIVKNIQFLVGIVDKSNKLLYFCNIKDGLTANTLQGKTEFTSGKLQKNQPKTTIIIGTNGNTITNYVAP